MPNIRNFEISGIYNPWLLQKMIYIPPIEYDYNPHRKEREKTPFTTFFSTGSNRRRYIMQRLWEHGILVINYSGITTSDRMKVIYDSKAIMINIHQTEHHHTFEEFRVLPALLRGLVVICEESPLISSIPYSQFVVWSSINDLPMNVMKVKENYNDYVDRFFGPQSELPFILANMRNDAYKNMEKRILQITPRTNDLFFKA
jgi:hypothetical protein